MCIWERAIASDALEAQLITLQEQGKTAMLIALDGTLAGVVAVADTMKVGSADKNGLVKGRFITLDGNVSSNV